MEQVSVLGIDGAVHGGLLFLDDTDVQFVSGRCLVRYDTETRLQSAIPCSASAVAVTAVAVTANRRTIAFAERSLDGVAAVYIVDWAQRKKRRLTCFDGESATVVYLSFTQDGRTVLVQTSAPQSSMFMVAWEKGSGGKVTGTIHCVPPSPGKLVTAINSCSSEPQVIAAVGKGFVRLFRQIEGAFKTLAVNMKRDPGGSSTEFTCHQWVGEDRHIVGTAAGDVFVLQGSELVRILDPVPAAGVGIMPGAGGLLPVVCLRPYSKGFVVGCAGGVFRAFEKTDDTATLYRCTRSIALRAVDGTPVTDDVTCLSFSPDEEELVALTRSGQCYTIKFAAIEIARHGLEEIVASGVRSLLGPFHSVPPKPVADPAAAAAPPSAASVIAAATGKNRGYADIPLAEQGITGLSIAARKPLFATCGADKSVRIWNYTGTCLGAAGVMHGADGLRTPDLGEEGNAPPASTPVLELVQYFEEVPSAIAMHPAGTLVVVGLASTLKLCTVVLGHTPPQLRTLKEFPIWQALDVAFNHGGGLFAAAAGSNISILSTWTGATVATLRGHGDKVVAIAWSRDDRCLVSVSRDGCLIRWAVSVANAGIGGGNAVQVLTAMAGGPVPLPGKDGARLGSAARRGSVGSGPAPSAPTLIGTVLAKVEIKDFTPLSFALIGAENGKEAVVTGVVMNSNDAPGKVKGLGSSSSAAGPAYTPVIKHVVLDAATLQPAEKEGVRIMDAKDGGKDAAKEASAEDKPTESPIRAVAALHSVKLLIAGLAKAVEAPPPPKAKSAEPVAEVGALSPSRSKQGTPTPRSSSPSRAGGSSLDARQGAVDAAPAVLAVSRVDKSGSIRLLRVHDASEVGAGRHGKDSVLSDTACHAAPVLRVAVSRDEQLIISAAADGSIALWRNPALAERAPAAAPVDHLRLSDTILLSKAEVDALNKEKRSLEAKLQEVSVSARRSERLKMLAGAARVAELQAKFAEETEAARLKTAELVHSKERMEQQCESQIAGLATSQTRELTDVESLYSTKLAAEIGRYDKLVAERDRNAAEAQATAAAQASRQASEIEELRSSFESLIAEEHAAVACLEAERAGIAASSVRAASTLEGDVEGEMSKLRVRYEMRVAAESTATLLLRGENGFMKRKFLGVNREIAEQKEEMLALADKEKELSDAITSLTKDVAGHKKEIREREETIQDKDNRIFELKKKNQELEKFKFVLNYKIQELKRQIMPRKKEISDMREQLKEMELELLQYHKSNAALDLMIGELKLKRDGVAKDVAGMDQAVAHMEVELGRVANDLLAVRGAGLQGEPGSSISNKSINSAMVQLYAKYIHGDSSGMRAAMVALGRTMQESMGAAEGKSGEAVVQIPPGVNVNDIAEEMSRQRQHLEKHVESITKKIHADGRAADADRNRLLKDNTMLTEEVNDLRRDLKYLTGSLAAARQEAASEMLGSMASTALGSSSTSGTMNKSTGAGSKGSMRRTGAALGLTIQSSATTQAGVVVKGGH